MGASLGASSGPVADLNLTPLIDIVLVVLIIMMVNIPITVEEMGIKVPGKVEVQPPRTETPPEQLAVAVYEDGTLALNRRQMTEEVLFYEVGRRLVPMDKKNVFIDGHPKVPYARIVDMMDLAREAGATKVGLARLKEEGPKPPNSVAPGAAPRGISVGMPIVVGAIGAKNASEVFQSFKGRVRSCYEQRLATNAELSGRMGLRLAVGPDGAPMSTEITGNSLNDEQVEACVVQVLEGMRFPALGEGKTAIVQYPVLFSPG